MASGKSTDSLLADGMNALDQARLEKVIAQSRKDLRILQQRDAQAEAAKEKHLQAQDEERYRRRLEQEELDDDPDAEKDEDELQAAPKKRKALSKAKQNGKYWNQSDEEGPHSSSDEEIVVPQRKKQRGAQIIIGKPTQVVSRLPQRRGHGRSASTASSVTAVSSPSHPPPPSSDAPTTPPKEPRAKSKTTSYTPYSQEHSVYTTQGKQSPPTNALLNTAYHHFRLKIALEEAFPDDTLRVQMAKAAFLEACQEDGVPRRQARFKDEKLYALRMTNSIGERVAQLRGEVKTKAQGLVSAQYGLASLSEGDVKAEVGRLMNRGTFHFADTKQRKGMFGNMIIPMVFAEQWLKRKSAEGAGRYSKHFNPCSLPLLALIVTAIECSVLDYETGLYNSAANQFSHQEYDPVYRRHIASLEKYQKKAPAHFAQLQQKIWTDGWRIAGRSAPKLGVTDDLDDDDFDEILQHEAGPA